jgi:hypothetical protein
MLGQLLLLLLDELLLMLSLFRAAACWAAA